MSEFKVDWVRDEIAFVRFFLSALSLSLPLLPSNLSLTLSHTPSSIVARDIIITVINDKQTRRKKTREEREKERKRKEKFQTRELNEFLCPPKKKMCIFAREMTLLATLFERFRAYHRILSLFLSAARVVFLTFLVSRKPPVSLFFFALYTYGVE
jgi:hypothetical protein